MGEQIKEVGQYSAKITFQLPVPMKMEVGRVLNAEELNQGEYIRSLIQQDLRERRLSRIDKKK